MFNTEEVPIFHWSTDGAPAASRFEQYAEMLRRNLIRVTTACDDQRRFSTEMRIAHIGRLQFARINGSAKRSYRTRQDIAASGGRAFHLVSGSTAWEFECKEKRFSLPPGDLVLIDTQLEYSSRLPDGFQNYTVVLPVDFIHAWLPDPTAATGIQLPSRNGWGQVLSAYVNQLAATCGSRLPLQASILEDQLGALIALAASDGRGDGSGHKTAHLELRSRILDSIRQRCTDSCLTALDVAADARTSPRTLHRVLATAGETFGAHLIEARCAVAHRMLTSPQFDSLTIAEIGRRAGFVDTSHFSRTCRMRYGHPPAQLRRKHRDAPSV